MFMKKIRILSMVIACVVIMSTIFVNGYVNTYDFKVGDTIGYTKYTDTRAFINDNEIQVYSINDYIFVAAEDLADYYFKVEWNDDKTELHIKRDANYVEGKVDFTPDPNNKGKVGASYLPILFNTAKVYFEGYFLRSFDINGKLAVYLDDLAAFTGGDYAWDAETKTLDLVTIPYFFMNPLYAWEYNMGDKSVNAKIKDITRSIVYRLRNKSTDDTLTFNVIKSTGDYGGLSDITFAGTYVSFTVRDGVEMTGKFWETIFAGVNIENGKRVETDTHERRIALYDGLKIYINDTFIGGELRMDEADGATIFRFNFDEPYAIEDIDTIQIDIG